jgi:hypothetical protein
MERRCGGNEEQRQIELSARAKEGTRMLESKARRCGSGWEWRCPFIGARGGLERWQWAAVNGVNTINGRAGLGRGLRLGI